MANLAIKGHATRGEEVIEILGILGGSNAYNHIGNNTRAIYYIDENYKNFIICSETKKVCDYIIFTLEEFLEKFPYKVGDKVSSKYLKNYEVSKMEWESVNNRVIYKLQGMGWYSADELQPYKKETMDKVNKAVFDANAQCCDIMNRLIKEETMEYIKIDIPKRYEFAGVDDDKQQVVFEKIGYQYPKTFEECCDVLKIEYPYFKTEEDGISASTYKNNLVGALKQLLICRDAYWKIAGEQMGFGKPWESDYTNEGEKKFSIWVDFGKIKLGGPFTTTQMVLSFPTKEMRDAFYENFKDLIEQCKELL